MATPNLPNALIAADTNVLLDLAEGKEHALDALSTIKRRLKQGRLLVSPTAFQELVLIADHGDTADDRKLALKALNSLSAWEFDFVNLVPVGHGIVKQIAERLVEAEILPVEEFNDALILAEAALLGCAILLSSDGHLRDIDFQRAAKQLNAFDVEMPVIATPREIVAKFF